MIQLTAKRKDMDMRRPPLGGPGAKRMRYVVCANCMFEVTLDAQYMSGIVLAM